MNSKKETKFKKVASRRTENIIKHIKLLSNCSNKNNYSYSEDDTNKVFRAIDAELKICKALFNKNKPKKKFQL